MASRIPTRPIHELTFGKQSLREALDLEPIPANLRIPRQGPTRPQSSGGKSKASGSEDSSGRGGSGGQRGGGGGAGGAGGGAGMQDWMMKMNRPTIAEIIGVHLPDGSIRIAGRLYEAGPKRVSAVTKPSDEPALTKDPAVPALWARFYEIESGHPIFSHRGGVVKYEIAQIGSELRSYSSYRNWGESVACACREWGHH